MSFDIIVIIILLILLIFCLYMVVITTKAKKKRKTKIKTLKKQGMTIHTTLLHVNGLPLAENIPCQILSYPDKLEFKSGTTNINLERRRITDMCIKTDTEIQKQVVSSAGKAIAGGMVFGPLGALIGGRAKTKNVRKVSSYLIITYLNAQNIPAYIGFDTSLHPLVANNLVAQFRLLNTSQGVNINLGEAPKAQNDLNGPSSGFPSEYNH